MGLLDKAEPVGDQPELIKLALYGYPGVGKTVLAASASRPIWIDFEKSADVLKYYDEYKHIPRIKPESMKQVDQIVKEFETSKDFDTIVFDTVTRMQFFQVAEHMQAVEQATKRDRHLPLFQDFRKSTEYLDEIFTALQNMEKNVIFIAHVAEDKNTEGQVIRIRPDLTPAVGSRFNGLLNVTAYLDLNNKGERTLLLNPTARIVAKNRLHIGTNLSNPTLEKLFNLEERESLQ